MMEFLEGYNIISLLASYLLQIYFNSDCIYIWSTSGWSGLIVGCVTSYLDNFSVDHIGLQVKMTML